MANARKSSRSSQRVKGALTSKAVTPTRSVDAPSTPLIDSDTTGGPPRRRRLPLRRTLISIGVVALLLLAGGLAYGWWTVQRALPVLDGTVKISGMSAPATVTRDKYGIPHIIAANVEDLYTAQGYVHAQDRLFQMYYFRQLGAGRLAEAFGPAAQGADIFLRTIGLRRAAEADLAVASPEVKSALEAYSRGVNAFLHTHTDALPLEFNLTGAHIDDWSPVDSLSFGKVMAYDLSVNWNDELIRSDLLAKVGPAKTAELMPDYATNGPVTVPGPNSGMAAPVIQAFNRDVRPWLPASGIVGMGSNNWVVDGTKSVTGKPLLANDPHLDVQNPSIWYQIQLETADGKYDVAGFGFAGTPGIVTGHNKNIAWGVTNLESDVQDLYIEKLDPQNHPGQFQTASGWKAYQVLTETIDVKGATPFTQTVRITDHGPLLSDAMNAVSYTIGSSIREALAFRWTALDAGHLLDSVYMLQTASNWQEFRAALAKWTVPGQNFVYADRQGNIGYQATGLQPIRKKGDGRTPVPGWTGEYDWNGYVPFDAMPRAYNPLEHYIATANNKPFGDGYSYPLEGAWAPPWRITRIREMLTAKGKLSAENFKEILMDTHSVLAREVVPVLAKLKPVDAKPQEAIQLLSGWDSNLSVDSSAASLYEVTVQQALSETFADELGPDLFGEYLSSGGSTVLHAFENLVSKPDDSLWDNKSTTEVEKRDDILLKSFNTAVADLSQAYGADTHDWTWGKLHTITPQHPFGGQPVISGIFNLPSLPFGGDGTTVSVGGYNLLAPYEMRSHQSYRMILDTSDWAKSQAVFAGGESGQPFSKHWGDELTSWQQNDMHPMFYEHSDIDANKEATLTISP